jgi:hypothetical protein
MNKKRDKGEDAMEMLESISIIGGADGPTSIFLAGVIKTQVLVGAIVIGLILCVFGLRLMKLLSAVVGLLIGAGIGSAIVAIAGLEGTVSLIVLLGCGIVMALLAFFLKRIGAFISVFCYVFGALMSVLPNDSGLFLIIAGAVALALAVVAAIYLEPIVVVVSSIAGGVLAGPAIIALVGLDEKKWIGYIIAAILAALGVLIQLLMQSGKIKKKEKMHSQKVKEEESRESEVEKARMILDDGEVLTDDTTEDGDDDLEIVIDEEL